MTCLLGRSGPWEFRAIAPRRVGPRHGDLVRGMGPFGPRHGELVRGMFGPRHGPFWSEAQSGNGPRDRLGVTVRYRMWVWGKKPNPQTMQTHKQVERDSIWIEVPLMLNNSSHSSGFALTIIVGWGWRFKSKWREAFYVKLMWLLTLKTRYSADTSEPWA